MDKAKHTPGPWEVVNVLDVFTGLGTDRGDGVRADSNDGWQICDCAVGTTSVNGADEQIPMAIQLANARLIAAAPELLEALQFTLELAVLKFGNLDEDANVIFDQARAAIAKATGA